MEIECQGCFYTVCSFVCLTEDLSEILQFLWKHGCLRKSYDCDRCGRKCAIGDKDLFFRCNRNVLDASEQCLQQPSIVEPSRDFQIFLPDPGVKHEYTVQISEYRPKEVLSAMNQDVHRRAIHLTANPPPPNQASLVFPTVDQHFLLMRPNATIIQSVPPEEIPNSLKSELADLDAGTQNRKRTKTTPSASNLKRRCNFKVSMKKGSIFEKSKLPIDTVCKFIVFWCCMKQPTQEFLRNELRLASRTVVDWSVTCREICINWAKHRSEKIGGVGIVVQVDEVKVLPSSKPGEQTEHGCSFWGIEKDTEKGKIFVVQVSSHDCWNLLNVINNWVLPGSIVVSSCWKSYDCLKLSEFVQQNVVHNKTFVNPPTNPGLPVYDGEQNENGKKTEDLHMPRFGTRRSHHLGDLAEFMFKRRYSNHLERMHAFFSQVALVYPLR